MDSAEETEKYPDVPTSMKSEASLKIRHDFTKEEADRYIKSVLGL